MADDDQGAKPAIPSPVEQPTSRGRTKSGAGLEPASEWTVSDRRGPLGSADDEDVERFVPAHETDAEGGADPAAHEPLAHAPAETFGATAAGEEATSGSHGEDAAHGASAPTTADESAHVASPTPPVAADPERKRSLVPIAAGLVIGALIGAGSAWLVYSQAGGGAGDPQQLATLSSRVDALDKRPDPRAEVAKLQSGLTDLQGKVAALEKRAPAAAPTQEPKQAAAPSPDQAAKAPEPTTPGQPAPSSAAAPSAGVDLAGKVAALQAALDEVKTRTGALQAQDIKQEGAADKVATLQTGVADAQKQAAGAQAALDAVKSQQKDLGDKIAGLTIAVAGALKKAEGAETDARTVQTQQKTLEGKLGSPALAVVADSLVQQIDAGRPYARQVDALAALNADPAKVAVLRENAARGVPSAQALLAQWKPLTDPVIATGNAAPADANFGQKLEHGLFGLVSVRRADGTAGNDLTSRVNLIAADLARDDVPGAFAAWQALPADAKAKSDSWGALAKTSVEALAAARDLQHAAIDALGAKKS